MDFTNSHEKAHQVLELLVNLLSVPANYTKFSAALPLTRICLLLLGERPTPFVATQVLALISSSIHISTSFIRKFELLNGWNVLKAVLPLCWDTRLNEIAFDILMCPDSKCTTLMGSHLVGCPQILPTILSALQHGLVAAADKLCSASTQGEFILVIRK